MDVELLYKDIKIKDGDVIVFGCSYGPDSMALLDILKNNHYFTYNGK